MSGFSGAPSPVKGWINFNGVGAIAIRASKNVSSITDNTTGNYDVNFAADMPTNDYAVIATGGKEAGDGRTSCHTKALTTSKFTIYTVNHGNGAAIDADTVSAVFFS